MAKKPGKRSFRQAIQQTGGVVSEIAQHFNVGRATVYRWLDYYEMRDEVMNARTSMRSVANDVIYQRLMSDDLDQAWEAAKHVSLHLNDEGELLMLSPDVLRILRAKGLQAADVVREFEAMIRAAAEKDKDEG